MNYYKPLIDVRYLIVHCSATPPDMDVGRKEIELWHRQRGFFTIGYHLVIRRDGTIEPGRPLDQPGAHCLGFNNVSRGVCMVGGVKRVDKNGNGKTEQGELIAENNFTPAQFASLEKVLRDWKKDFPLSQVVGHRDLDVDPKTHARLKDCPSFEVHDWAKPLGLAD